LALQKSSHIFTKIAFKLLRTNLFYIVLSAYFLTIGSSNLFAQEAPKNGKSFPSKNQTIKPKKEDKTEPSIGNAETKTINLKGKDSVKMKSVLEGKVKYRAKNMLNLTKRKNHYIIWWCRIKLLRLRIKIWNYSFWLRKNEVYAGRLKDSTGNYYQLPVFKQGANVIEPDSIRFNYKTKKALVWNSRTTQQELNIKAKISKKENDSVYFMKSARLTTAKDIDDPEYYFLVNKMKFVPGKK